MNHPDPYVISICKQIEAAHGNAIKNMADAKRLAEEFAAKKLHISSHTLARLYGVVKPFRKPYKDTLHILAQFLSFVDWDDFCQNQTNIPFDPNFFLTEAADGFSLAVLQLALDSQDLQALQTVLSKISSTCTLSLQIAAAEMLGTHLRNLSDKQPLLAFLARNPMGQRLFYESYVDEDDQDGYFSQALLQHYLPHTQNNYRRLFVNAFLISNQVHRAKYDALNFDEFNQLVQHLDWQDCHFHEKSRWLELNVMQDYHKGILNETWNIHLEKALLEIAHHPPYEQAWILARPLKAFLLFDWKAVLCTHQAFMAAIDRLVQNQKKGHHSIALYALQLFWLYTQNTRNNKPMFAPFRLHSTWFQNEANEKKAIEFGIAFLFATGENKKIIWKHLPQFCQDTGNSWVLRLLH